MFNCFPREYFVLLGFRVRFELLKQSYPPLRKCTDYCGLNMSTNMALETRTRCYSFDQSVRKCNDSLVVNITDRVISTAVLLLLCVKHHAHRNNSKSRVYSGPPTRSYTAAAAAAGVAVRCCCCCGLGTRTHAHKNCASDLWVEGIHRYHVEGHTRQPRLRSKQALASAVSQ